MQIFGISDHNISGILTLNVAIHLFLLAIWVERPMLYTHTCIAVGPYVVLQAVRKMEDDIKIFRCFEQRVLCECQQII
jgi:hypothetical protein